MEKNSLLQHFFITAEGPPTILKGETAMFKQILVPLDGSTRAEQALAVATRLARASSGSIVLVRVANLAMDYGG